MRILLASSSSGSRGGGEIFLLYLGAALRAAGHEPMLWCSTHERMDELVERFESIGPVFRDDYPNSYHDRRFRVLAAAVDFQTVRRLSKRFQQIECDLIHLNKQTLEDGLDLLAAVQASSRPVVTTIHITQSSRSLGAVAGGLRDAIALRSLRGAKQMGWTAVSDARARELKAFFNGEIHTIYNAVSEHPPGDRRKIRGEILSARGWPEDAVLVVCVARLVPQKDPDRFLRLAAELHQVEPNTRFLWVGDGEERERFLQQSRELGIGDAVDCSGWSAEPRYYLSGADLYLHPAAYEGLPLAILEAMAASLPCVLSPEIAAEVNVFDESNVIIAHADDRKWGSLAASPETRHRYGVASRELYENHFRPEAMAASFLALYQSKLA
jgi:glycosyltransferase involved in cell wall biosynthesis